MQIIILGMHRSGTSVLTRFVNMMGAYVGAEGTSTGANKENPKGFWERRDVRLLNDFVLHSTGCDWNRVAGFSMDMVPKKVQDTFLQQAAKLVLEMDGHRPWVMKEPRLCLLLPLWKQVLELPVCLHVHRDPLEVAASLSKRNGVPVDAGLGLWEKYLRDSIIASQDMKQAHLQHQELMSKPMESVRSVHQALVEMGVRGLALPSPEEVERFVDLSLYHERAKEHPSGDIVASAYRQLQAQVLDGGISDRDISEASRRALERYEAGLGPMDPAVIERARSLPSPLFSERMAKVEADLKTTSDASSERIEALAGEMASCAGSVARIDESLEKKTSAIKRLGMRGTRILQQRMENGVQIINETLRELVNQRQAEDRIRELELELDRTKVALDRSSRESSELSIDVARLWGRLQAVKSEAAVAEENGRRALREVTALTAMLRKEEDLSEELRRARELEASLSAAEAREARAVQHSLAASLDDAAVCRKMMEGFIRALQQDRLESPASPAGHLKVIFGRRYRAGGKGTWRAREEEWLKVLRHSDFFDAAWYLQRYRDVAESGMDPHRHFLAHGALEGRDPGPEFGTLAYCRANPDVADSGMNPLVHFELFGRSENRPFRSGDKE